MKTSETLTSGHLTEPFFVEYVKRTDPFTMPKNDFHPFYEIYYLISGKRIYFIKDASYPIEEGDLVFINKNELHKTLHAGESSHERIVMHFDEQFIDWISKHQKDFLLSPFQQKIHVLRLPKQEQAVIKSLISRTVTEIQQKPPGYEIYLAQAIVHLLLHSARFLQKDNSVSVSVQYDTPMHKKMADITRYINEYYSEPLNLTLLSKQFYISPYYLSRMFKEITGFSFTDYLNIIRVKEAQRLLRETRLKITDVAADVGFDNFSHFGKIFKKITRVSPRDYRKDPI